MWRYIRHVSELRELELIKLESSGCRLQAASKRNANRLSIIPLTKLPVTKYGNHNVTHEVPHLERFETWIRNIA